MAFKPFAMLFKPVVLCVGFIYPSYASFKALESKAPTAAAQWLTYWVVFSLFTVLEYFADYVISWLPFYYLAKLAFVLWLQLPQTQGATQLYIHHIQPLVKQHEEEIDRRLEEGRTKAQHTITEVKSKTMTWLHGTAYNRSGGGGARSSSMATSIHDIPLSSDPIPTHVDVDPLPMAGVTKSSDDLM